MSRTQQVMLLVNPSEAVAALKEFDGIKVKSARTHMFVTKLRQALAAATPPSDTSAEPSSDT